MYEYVYSFECVVCKAKTVGSGHCLHLLIVGLALSVLAADSEPALSVPTDSEPALSVPADGCSVQTL